MITLYIDNMDKITESLQKMLLEKELKFQTLFNSLTKDGSSNMTSTSVQFNANPDKEESKAMSVVIDIDPTTSHFYIAAYPYVAFTKRRKDDVEELISKWNNCGYSTSIVFEDDKGVPVPGNYCIHVHVTGFSPTNGLDAETWSKYLNLVRENTSYVLEILDEFSKEEPF